MKTLGFESETFDGVHPTIDIITKKQIWSCGWISADFKQLDQVVVLAMDVPTDGDWRLHFKKIGLFGKDTIGHVQDLQDLIRRETTFSQEMVL
ncbi:hypothetical protein WICPIJ_005321 [Wickerhamomyces pijperi]|uniref:Uncharacterized protein n=1 Tax=Wickerhamomyces pijperi TaxID=599730 RepID=A0A9P8Q3T4_WICPI|nr:hypothetical protein WICPIJ_005321 [Wickerhamomyces pijperi]